MYFCSLRSHHWHFVTHCVTHLGGFFFWSVLFVVLFKYAYHLFIFTLGQFSAYQFDGQLVFYFLFSFRLPDVHFRRLVLHRLPLFLPITSPIFVLNRRRPASEKPAMASVSPVESLAMGEPNAVIPPSPIIRSMCKQLPDKSSGTTGQQ